MKGMYSLVNVDGNAYAIMGYVIRAMKDSCKPKAEIDAYIDDAMSSNYAHLVSVSNDMVDKLNEELIKEGRKAWD